MFLVPEVEWDDTERAWVDALRQYRESLCPCGCGWPRLITLDPMTEFRLTVDAPVTCQITKRTVLAAREWAEKPGAYSGPGVLWATRLHPGDDQPLTG